MKTLQKPQYKTIQKPRVKNGIENKIDLQIKPSQNNQISETIKIEKNYIGNQSKNKIEQQQQQNEKELNLEITNSKIKDINEMNKNEIKNLQLIQKNDFQENETWVDEKDFQQKPIFSRLVTDPHNKNFIQKNLRILVNTDHEYYPYFCQGNCLCGQCTCGKCKCVHLKYKLTKDLEPPVSSYQQDYQKWNTPVYQRAKNNNDGVYFKFPIDYQSTNRLDYAPKNNKKFMNEKIFPNNASKNNIEPFLQKLKAPVAKDSSYKHDFPNWEINKEGKIDPLQSIPQINKIPFLGKNVNAEYGDFYQKGIKENQLKNQKVEDQKYPIAPQMPQELQSHTQQQFRPFDLQENNVDESFKPKDNLKNFNNNYQDKYKTSNQTQGLQQEKNFCPVQIQMDKMKEKLRKFAQENKIYY